MTERPPKTILTEHDHDQMTAFLKFWVTSLHFLPILSKCSNWFPKYRCKVLSVRHLQTPPKKSVAEKFVFNSKLLYLCTSNRKKASLVPKVGLYRRHIWVSIDVRRRTSITTQRRARNGASGELKYQPSKHTKVWLTTVLPCGQWTVTSLLSIRLNHVSTRQKREGKNPDQADINLVKTEKKNAFAVSQYSDVMTIEKFAKHIKVYCINDI